ncbi:hypothetical protein CISG_05031 [Coccidioides immitis RMSCC 3703]|uniref:Uncharacterized protein n=1 Tax=Coccidioides immitis RMSCC 3703 TaxID=454286 RepID=A0A0J8QSC3_COCIT|nr:hypothetical protein CISG_05031 [Coccidioides immitis RMSCC 3703]
MLLAAIAADEAGDETKRDEIQSDIDNEVSKLREGLEPSRLKESDEGEGNRISHLQSQLEASENKISELQKLLDESLAKAADLEKSVNDLFGRSSLARTEEFANKIGRSRDQASSTSLPNM